MDKKRIWYLQTRLMGIGYEYNSHKDTKGEEYLKFCEEWFNVFTIKL
jgi:hypothetical protein